MSLSEPNFRMIMFFLSVQIIFSIACGAIIVKENPDKDSSKYAFGITTIIYSIIWLVLSILASLGIYNVFINAY
jgi:hypothetical protein